MPIWISHLLAIALAATPAVRLPDATRDRWHRVDTPNFTLFTNGGAPLALQVGRQLERLAEVLELSTGGLVARTGQPTYFYLFDSDASFTPYKILFDGKPGNIGGYFLDGADGNYLAVSCESTEQGIEVAQHEYIHSVLARSAPNGLPVWLNEGMAEFYSSFRAGRREADIGRLLPEHAARLFASHEMPLPVLFSVGQNSPDYHSGDRQAAFYAQSWGFVHFLILGDPEGRFGRLVTRLRDGVEVRTAFRAVYGSNLDSLELAFASYLDRTSLPYKRLTFTDDLETVTGQGTELGRAEVLRRLGDLLAEDGERPAEARGAEAHLAQALEVEPAHAAALARLALVRRRSALKLPAGETRNELLAAADDDLERVRRLEPRDPVPYLLATTALFEQWEILEPVYEPGDTTAALLLAARDFAERGLAVAPGHPELSAAFGRTFIADREVSPLAVAALMEAAEAMPSRTDLAATLVRLYCNWGNATAAHGLYALRLRGRVPAEDARNLAVTIANTEVRKGARLVRDGRREEARALLERAVSQAEHPDARKLLEEALQKLGSRKE